MMSTPAPDVDEVSGAGEEWSMGMAWPWKQRARQNPFGGWFSGGWRDIWDIRRFAMVRQHRPTGADGTPPRASAAPAGGPSSAAFEAFFLRYERQITSYLWRMTGDEQSASELAQETFLRAWQHFDAVSQYEQPLAWLFRVATNLARQHYRRQKVPVRRATPLDDEIDPASSDPTLHVAEQELVRQTLLQLKFQQRAALVLCEVYGLSCAEVGTLLNMSRDAVKMALWRAREQFRVRYLREGEDAR
jgi:RNA polymerase sigma-70 factor (ECF subfamily)